MATRQPLETDEWYHCFNRGSDKRVVFRAPKDYERFMALLYVSNGTKPVRISDRRDTRLHSILLDETVDRGDPLVDIGVYSLMPNHIHIVLQQLQDDGIARFMQKVFTGYTMYFNLKYDRTGVLFSGVFKSKHIDSDRYLKQAVPYVLLNVGELFDSGLKKGRANIKQMEKRLLEYPYSSLIDFVGRKRPEGKILGTSLSEYFEAIPSLSTMLRDADAYYREHKMF